MYMFFSFAKNKDMKKSTKILLVLYILILIPSIIFGKDIFSALKANGQGFEFDFNVNSIAGLVCNALSLLLGTILFFRFITSRPMDKAIFFSSMPLVLFYGVTLFLIAQLATYQNDTARTVSALLNITADNNYNTILWAVLVTLVFIVLLFLNFIILCRQVSRVERIVARLGDGKVKDKIRIGGVKQFETIEHGLNKINENYKEKDQTVRQFKVESEKFIPKQFFRFLGRNSISQLELGRQVEKTAATVLIKLTRVRNERDMTLEENFHFVNSYVNVISPIIRKFGGFIDKYLGEGIVAVFPSSQESLDCVHAMARAIEIKNRQNKTLPNVALRVALAYGEISFGIIGEQDRKIPTIVSNVMSDLEKLDEIARLIGAGVVFVKPVIDALPLHYKFAYRLLGPFTTYSNTVTQIFQDIEVSPKDNAKLILKTKAIFEKGVLFYSHGEYQKACTYMEEVLQVNPSDRCAYVYFNKCKEKMSQLT